MDDQKKRSRFLPVRISNEEMKAITDRYKKTACGSFSEFVRYALLERPIVSLYRNASLDALMQELIATRKELNAIGKNINSIARSIQSTDKFREKIFWLNELQVQLLEFTRSRDKIQSRINQIAEKWLPESKPTKG